MKITYNKLTDFDKSITHTLDEILHHKFMSHHTRLRMHHDIQKDFGLNPMEINEMFYYLEDKLSVNLDNIEPAKIHTVKDLVQAIKSSIKC